jgi:uncharacterized membrane protein
MFELLDRDGSGDLRQVVRTRERHERGRDSSSRMSEDRRGHLRFHEPHLHLTAPFGTDWFGRKAESFARLFGTPAFLVVQTALVAAWIAINVAWAAFQWDPYPFILLNLAFSLQAAYAAPLILLAQTRQADRDKALALADAEQREAIARDSLARQDATSAQAAQLRRLLEANTALTVEVERLTREMHRCLLVDSRTGASAGT